MVFFSLTDHQRLIPLTPNNNFSCHFSPQVAISKLRCLQHKHLFVNVYRFFSSLDTSILTKKMKARLHSKLKEGFINLNKAMSSHFANFVFL